MAKSFVKFMFIMLLLGALLSVVVPNFVNWNRHKDTLVHQLSKYVKDDIKINVEGNVSLRVVPRPELIMEHVSISKGAENNEIIKLQQLGALIKFKPLLEGVIEFEYLELVNPVLELETDAEGSLNDISIFKESSNDNNPLAKSAVNTILLNKVSVLDGQIIYKNKIKKIEINLQDIDLSIEADNLSGPYNISGSMEYNKDTIGIEIKTNKYKTAVPVTVNAVFSPYDPNTGFPEIKYSGVLDMEFGIALQGELSVADGVLNKVVADNNLSSVVFMQDKIKMRSLLSANKEKIMLSNIEASIGKNSMIKGDVSLDFIKDKPTFLSAELEAKNLILTRRLAYMGTPEKFDGKIKIKGDNFVIAGENIPYANASISFASGVWDINSASLYMKGSAKTQLSGRIDAAGEKADYSIKSTVKDFKGFVNSLPIPADNIFNALENNSMMNGISFSADVKLRSKQVSVNNLVTKIGGADFKGYVNIDREEEKKNFSSKLNVENLDLSASAAAGFHDILKAVVDYQSNIEIEGKNIKNKGVVLKDLSLKASTSGGIVSVESMNAVLDDKNTFAVMGKIQGIAPVAMLDISYSAQANKPEKISEFFGIKLPLLQSSKNALNVKGKLKGNVSEWFFDIDEEIENGKVLISGSSKDKWQSYNASMNIQSSQGGNSLLTSLGFPVGNIFAVGENLELSGSVSGNGKYYKIDNIKAKVGETAFSGSLTRDEENKTKVFINADYVDLERFINSPLQPLPSGFVVSIQGKSSFDGGVSAEISSASSGSVNIKGKVSGIDLGKVAAKSGIKNKLTFMTGDVEFDLNKASTITGVAGLKIESLDLPGLNYDGLGYLINGFDYVPKDLEDEIRSELSKGDISLKDFDAKFQIAGEKISLTTPLMSKSNDCEFLIEKLLIDLNKKTYSSDIRISVLLPKPMPAIKIRTESGKKLSIEGIKEIESFIVKNNPPPVDVQDNITSVPEAAEAGEPVVHETESPVIIEDNKVESAPIENEVKSEAAKTPEEPLSDVIKDDVEKSTDDDAIGGILDRLEE